MSAVESKHRQNISKVWSILIAAALLSATPAFPADHGQGDPAQVPYGSNQDVGRYVEVDGVDLYYEVYGHGQPLILLHGGLGSIHGFQESIPALSTHFRVIAYDRGGHGRSHDSGRPFDYRAMADETVQFMDALRIPSAFMVGFSDGGVVGYHIAARYPERITRLVAVGANQRADALTTSPAALRQMMDPDRPAPWVSGLEPAYRNLSPDPDFKRYIERSRDLWTGDSYPSQEVFQQITIPVLLVCGDRDLVPVEHATELYRTLDNAQLCVIPNCDHFVFSKHTALINRIVLAFLTNQQ